MAEPPLAIDGLLIVDKPAGWTSHDVIGRLRRLTGIRRIGHAGTLDPLATGVLPLGIGQGTRVLEYISDAEKEYTATLELGAVTDTYDADGAVIERSDWTSVSEASIRHVLDGFHGEIEQQPPIYSAIKHQGVPMHRLARAGKAVAPPTRSVTIAAIEVVAIDLPRLTIAVTCSKGTYIRSLAHDIGRRLGCGAHLTALRRMRTGGFSIAQARTIEQFELALADGSWPASVLPLDLPLRDCPALILSSEASERLQRGVAPSGPAPDAGFGPLARAYAPDGAFLAILRWQADDGGWKAEKVLLGR